MLKEALSDATHIVLAFDAKGPMSPGTTRTLVESFRLGHSSGRVRRNGMIEEVPLAHNWRRIDFAGGSAMAIAIPWGDLATAWFSTGIPNIETYAAVPLAAAYASRALNWLRPLLASAPGQMLLQRLANGISVKNSYALRDLACGARCAMPQASGAQRIWKLPTVIA